METGEEFTKSVLKRWEDIPDPRLREVMQSAIKHLHGFVSEVQPTGAEWFKAIEFLTAIGHKCDDKRQEFILLSDTHGRQHAGRRHQQPPRRRRDAEHGRRSVPHSGCAGNRRRRQHGEGSAPGIPCFVTGTVRGPRRQADRGRDARPVADRRRRPLRGAAPHRRAVDARHLPPQADGSFSIRTVAPISYTIPMDGPVGDFFTAPT